MTIQIMPETPHPLDYPFISWSRYPRGPPWYRDHRSGWRTSFSIFLPHVFYSGFVFIAGDRLGKSLPILHTGWKPIIYGSLTTTTFPFAELVCVLVILPSVNNGKRIPKSMLAGALLGGITLEIMILLTIAVLGAPMTANQIYPAYSLAKKISIGNFLERIEAMLAIMWIVTTYFKTILNFYALMHGIANLTKLSDPKLATLPLGMILVVSSLVSFPDITYFNDLVANYWPYLDFTICLALPLLLLGLHFTAKKS